MFTNLRSPRRILRKRRVRKKVRGTDARPRLSVSRSARHMYAQIITDEGGSRTLVAVSTLSPELREKLGTGTGNRDAAKEVGALIAQRALAAGVSEVVFDRNGHLYHGRVRSLAEAAREAGLRF